MNRLYLLTYPVFCMIKCTQILFLSLFILTSCNQLEVYKIEAKNDSSQLIINTGDKDVKFNFYINDLAFPFDSFALVNLVQNIAKRDSTPVHVAAWQFVANQTIHANAYDSGKPENLFASINSRSYGLCGERSKMLSQLWQLLGFDSRVCSLHGHIVPEVYIESAWQVFDPDHEVFYLDSQNKVMNVETLIANPELISYPIPLANYYEEDELSDYLKYNSNTSLIFSHCKEPNYIVPTIGPFSTTFFLLPAKSKLTFPFVDEYSEDIIIKKCSYLKIDLAPKPKIQKLAIPLSLYKVKGNCTIKDTIIGTNSFYIINNKQDSVELLFLTNPRLEAISPISSVQIEGQGLTETSIKLLPKSVIETDALLITDFIFDEVKALSEDFDLENFDLDQVYTSTLQKLNKKYDIEINDKLLLSTSQEKKILKILDQVNKSNYQKEFVFYLLMVMYNNEVDRFGELVSYSTQKLENYE